MKIKLNLPLVNAHTHAAMVAFRGTAEDLPLRNWLEDHIWPMERARLNPQFVYRHSKKALREMRRNGIRAFADMYFFQDEVIRAAEELKMSALLGEPLVDFPAPSYKTPDEAFKILERQLKEHRKHPFVKIGVITHTIYTVCAENLVKAKRLAKKYNTVFYLHLAETKKEFDDCRKANKATPVEYLNKLGVLDNRTVLAHCVWLTSRDIKILARAGSHVVHCPLSNLKLGSGIAPVAELLKAGVNVALGTDGAASSNRLDIWEAGKFAALLQKGLHLDPTVLDVKTVLKMMSVNGMRALGFSEIEGRGIAEIEKEIDNFKHPHILYEKHANEIFNLKFEI
ncbi:MAG: amidohydrolase family protein [Candidatus Moranbacteria bacterium]|nr:amidohydrolase family protein [Candidatus Moranbacteria bacterium]